MTELFSTTSGRDKVAKIAASICRVSMHLLEQPEDKNSRITNVLLNATMLDSKQGLLSRLNALDSGIGTCRKAMRLFRFVPGFIVFLDFLLKYLPIVRYLLHRWLVRLDRKSRVPLADAADKRIAVSLDSLVSDVLKVGNSTFLGLFFLFDNLNWLAKLKLMSNATPLRGLASWSLPQLLNNNGA
jgi:hypothetical protein